MGSRITIPLPKVVLSYPHLFVARAAVVGGAKKFSASFLIDGNTDAGKALIKNIKTALREIADADFKGEMPERLAFKKDKKVKNQWIVSSYANTRPVVVDNKRRPLEETAGGQNDLLFPGCIVNANVNAYSYPTGGNGIAFGLEGVQWVSSSERLGEAHADAEEMFEEEEGEDPNVTGFEDAEEEEVEEDDDW